MKATLFAMMVFCLHANAGPAPRPKDFIPSVTRQDFTGQGTFHRQGLIREQERARNLDRTARTQDAAVVKKSSGCFLAKFWQSLFSKKSLTPVSS